MTQEKNNLLWEQHFCPEKANQIYTISAKFLEFREVGKGEVLFPVLGKTSLQKI